jgi:nucleoside-diphosphate-sugar epimerase
MQKQKWCSMSSSKNNKYTLVTGASGFIGRNLCATLKEKGYFVRGAVRSNASDVSGVDEHIQVGDINELTEWQQALAEVDTVIHLAARVHIKSDSHKKRDSHFLSVADPIEAFRKVNVLGTERLARMAAKAGARRFIFVSSIGVNGDSTEKEPFTEDNVPNPVGAYAVSKWEAEQTLHKISKENGMEIVILRLPLVYGLNAPGNFGRLMSLIKTGLPLPLGNIMSLRSFLYLGNLVDAIITCIAHPLAVGETFLVSDGQDISTPDLMRMIADVMAGWSQNLDSSASARPQNDTRCKVSKKLNLFYLHPSILRMLCKIAGKTEELEKLTGTLVVDSSKIRNMLGWKPPFTLEEGIRETIK